MKFAEIIKGLRTENGFTQKHLASLLGIHQSNISDWENEISRPEYELLIKLADIFDVSLDELLGRRKF